MDDDYFENKTRHVLPIANKSLIKYLIETLYKDERIGDKYIKIEEKIENNEKKKPSEEVYKLIFGNLIGNGIELPGQDSLTQRGTFGAVKAFIDKYIKKDIFPLLILYGDTLVEGNFLEHIIDQYDKEQKGSKILWGLVKHETKDKKSMGDVVTEPIDIPKDDFKEIDEKNIIDIFEQQKKESYDLLHDTGIMLLSEDAWNVIYDQIDKLQPSTHGISWHLLFY
jgi:NDP-sugar pyrophosphorylase family protein